MKRSGEKLLLIVLLWLNSSGFARLPPEEPLKVFPGKSDMLQNAYFLNRLKIQFDQRRENIKAASQSGERLLERRDSMRRWFFEKMEPLPVRTPLNPEFSSKTDIGICTIEKVSFESKPNHHITGLFYLPKKGRIPYPAVYIPCGHAREGKSYADYQKAARLFAMNGFAVLQADPICQGERFQYLNQAGKPVTREGTYMHEILGQAMLLTGRNTLVEELEDNIRCLDFLEQHPSVDKNKLAVAGHSGGGTQTTYLTAFDRRVKAATPVCYIATSEKKLNTIGSQDGCQQLWGEGKAGVEEQDFLFMAAPVPIRILSTEQDFFSIDGAKTAYEELKRMYSALNAPEKLDMVSCTGEHGWHKPLREASVQWCKKWLMNDPAPVTEPENIGFFEDRNQVTVCSTGQVMTAFPGEQSVIDLNRERVIACDKHRTEFQKIRSAAEILAKISELTGFDYPNDIGRIELAGSVKEKGYYLGKLLIERDRKLEFRLPALLFVPEQTTAKRPAVIMVGEDGKGAVREQIMEALKAGHIVLSLDVCNTGELQDKRPAEANNREFLIAKLPLYEGKTLMTYRIEDILLAVEFLQKHTLVDPNNISLFSMGYTGPAALHAAAIGRCFQRVKLAGSIESWRDVANARHSKDQSGNIVPNALNYYDLPDLIRLMPSTTSVEIISPVDAEGKIINKKESQ